jgi:hypothetical protein
MALFKNGRIQSVGLRPKSKFPKLQPDSSTFKTTFVAKTYERV